MISEEVENKAVRNFALQKPALENQPYSFLNLFLHLFIPPYNNKRFI